jgi:DNA-binding NarL/FixJ family response regulator
MKHIRLVLADDHRLVRDGIRALLADVANISIIADATTGDELLAILRDHALVQTLPDVVLLDVSMPSSTSQIQSGLEAAKIMTSEFPSLRILFLSMHEEAEYIINAMKSGAHGYLLKSVEKEELARAIETVARGERYMSSTVTARVMESFSPQNNEARKAPHLTIPTLTQREQEILQLVAEGLATKTIAEHLIISPRTVETHRTNIMHKLNAANTAELVRLALQYGLVKDLSA